MKFRVEHLFDKLSVAQFEKLYFDEPFNIALCQALRLSRHLERRDEKDGLLERIVRVGPDREIPTPVAKVLGSTRIEYTEHSTYRLGSFCGTWKTISSVMSDKVDSAGTFAFEARGNRVARIFEGDVKVRVFGIGGVVERFIVADVERSYDEAARFTTEWIKTHPFSS